MNEKHKPQILIVENHESVRTSLKEWLFSIFDYCIFFEAASGEEAITMAFNIKPNIIIMDIMLGKINGIEATKLIKSKLPQTEVIMVTNYEVPQYQIEAKRAGAYDYILKRQINKELVPTLQRLLPKLSEDKESIEILLIEDNIGDAVIIEEITKLNEDVHMNIHHVDYLKKGVEFFNNNYVDLILLDLNLPDSIGINTLKNLKKHALQTPIIVLTGMADEQVAIEALREGAQDYLIKGSFKQDMFIRAIKYGMERNKIYTQLKNLTNTLSAQERNIRTIIEKNADGIAIISKNRVIRFVNPSFEQIFGKTQKELLDSFFEFPLSKDESSEIYIPHKDGKEVFAEMQTVCIEWEGEEAFLTSIRDITYRKEVEQIMQEQERLKGVIEMAGAICHELDQPLQVLLSLSENNSSLDKFRLQVQKIEDITKKLNSITTK
ncbi:MAG: response regulator [Desulfobacterales bacterium]|nr:response regulator [Desulfobacterales bacterium]